MLRVSDPRPQPLPQPVVSKGMLGEGMQLDQRRPSGTSAVSAYTAVLRTTITSIVVTNVSASPVAYSLYHDDDGSTFDEDTALAFEVALAANSFVVLSADGPAGLLSLRPGGQIGVQSDTADAINFSIYGGVRGP